MRIVLALSLVGCVGCGSSSPQPSEPIVKMTAVATPIVTPIAEAPDDGIEMLGVEKLPVVGFTKNAVLYRTPDPEGDEVGVIRKGARAAVLRDAEPGRGCRARWIEVAPRGWVCASATEPTDEPPSPHRTYAITDDDPTPPVIGVYGVVRGKNVRAYDSTSDVAGGNGRVLVGNNSVRAAGSVRIDGKRYWRTSGGALIDASSIATFSPSKFRGVQIEDSARMPAWVRHHRKAREPVEIRARPSLRARPTGELAPRTVVTILEEVDGFARIQIGPDATADEMWIARHDLRATSLAPPPPGTAEDERWFDVDLDEQTLVAYEGERPVFATMVSTGKREHATPVVIARIVSKHERTTMSSDRQDVYSVADVPWTMFYDGNYALHSSYWHDGFGSVRSHGCINLSPYDARLLFRWSSPSLPSGWSSVRGDDANPGSLIRVRSRKHGEPRFRGYARELRDRAAEDAVATR